MDLLNAEKQVVYPILEWIFNDVDHLKERIYLATYLSQMDIPIDAQSPETNRLQQIIEQKMEEFKVSSVFYFFTFMFSESSLQNC